MNKLLIGGLVVIVVIIGIFALGGGDGTPAPANTLSPTPAIPEINVASPALTPLPTPQPTQPTVPPPTRSTLPTQTALPRANTPASGPLTISGRPLNTPAPGAVVQIEVSVAHFGSTPVPDEVLFIARSWPTVSVVEPLPNRIASPGPNETQKYTFSVRLPETNNVSYEIGIYLTTGEPGGLQGWGGIKLVVGNPPSPSPWGTGEEILGEILPAPIPSPR